ncbi:MAG: O-antigen ligase family protein [Anaerolineaceae bacterium]|jgi:O-antigen ligase/tetratricopeptide (TPR) repeat protein|nr:O-antigen ligase family protein [Anaerolineaceae bacterium]
MNKTIKLMNRRYLLRESALILLLSYFYLLASTHNGLVNYTIFTVTVCVFLFFEVLWIVFGQKVSIKKEIPILVFLVVLAVAAWFSIDPRRSWSEVWLLGAALFLFLLSSDLVSRGWGVDLWIKALLIVGGIVMLFTWREALVWYQQWFELTRKLIPEISYRLPAPNFLAVFLNLLLMMAAASFLHTSSKGGKVLLGLWAFSASGLIYLTSSRGGWLGTASGLGVLLLLAAFVFSEKRKYVFKWLRRHRWVTVLLVIGMITVLLVFGWVFIQQSKLPTHAALGDSRGYLWNPAWQAFKESPLIGSGPYTYISFYMQQQSTPPSPLFLYSHSIYLDLLSGSGVIGLTVFVVMIVCLALGLFRRVRETKGVERAAAMGALSALTAFLVHGVVDSVHHTIPTVAWVLAVVLGVGSGNSAEVKTRRVSISWLLGLGLAAAGILNLWAEKPMHEGAIAGNSGYWQEAQEYFMEAVRRDPGLATAYQQSGLVESKLVEDGHVEFMESAIVNFEAAGAIDPYWGLNHANLGVLYRVKGDYESAAEAMERAVAAAPDSALYQLNRGVTYELMGDEEKAGESYHTTLKLQPLWRDAYFWRETAFRQAFHEGGAFPAAGPVILSEAEDHLAVEPHRLAAYLKVIPFYLEAGMFDEAKETVNYAKLAYTANPEESLRLRWYEAELAASQGEFLTAAKNGEEIIDQLMQQGIYGYGSFGTLMYDQLVFRRPAMVMEVVPQMTMITLPDEWGERLQQVALWYREAGENNRADELMETLGVYIPDYRDQLK